MPRHAIRRPRQAPELWQTSGAPPLLDSSVAVGKTPGEHAGSLVRVGSENGYLVRRTQAVRCEDVVHGGSEVHLRKRAARFLERLYPTATSTSSTAGLRSWSSPKAAAGAIRTALSQWAEEPSRAPSGWRPLRPSGRSAASASGRARLVSARGSRSTPRQRPGAFDACWRRAPGGSLRRLAAQSLGGPFRGFPNGSGRLGCDARGRASSTTDSLVSRIEREHPSASPMQDDSAAL